MSGYNLTTRSLFDKINKLTRSHTGRVRTDIVKSTQKSKRWHTR